MSFDIHLLPLQQTDDFDAAMALLEALDRDDPDYAYELDARDSAQTILQLDSRYHPLRISAAETRELEATEAGRALLKRLSESVQLDGRSEAGQPLAQFHFNRYHITIHCYSGTSADELDRYVIALCCATGLAAVDPQECVVWRPQVDGTLARNDTGTQLVFLTKTSCVPVPFLEPLASITASSPPGFPKPLFGWACGE